MEGQPHPYAPTDLKLPGYAPNFLTQSTIVSVYGLSSLLVVSLIWILSEFTGSQLLVAVALLGWLPIGRNITSKIFNEK